ncbi:hypothetical protein GS504_01140 [Rhodococcus hoagii]|nr:hypothetical protein [Prescottella equi]NKS71723.1 hypothetical protein [Prescottella equi]
MATIAKGRHRLRRTTPVPTQLWESARFSSLPHTTQLLYLAIRCQSRVSPAGLVDIDVDGWGARFALDAAGIRSTLDALTRLNLIAVDYDTGELLLRKWAATVPEVIASAQAMRDLRLAVREIESPTLRAFLMRDMAAYRDHNDTPLRAARSASEIVAWLDENLNGVDATQTALFAAPTTTIHDEETPADAVPDISRAERPVDARALTGIWVTAFKSSHRGSAPSQSRIARFGASARQAIKVVAASDRDLTAAAQTCGHNDWIDISNGLGAQTRVVDSSVDFQHSDEAAGDAGPARMLSRGEIAAARIAQTGQAS